MASIENLTLWDQAVQNIDKSNYQTALENLLHMELPSAKILFNIASLHIGLGNPTLAVQIFDETIAKDEHMAVAYFQRGTAYFLNQKYPQALHDFQSSEKRLREKNVIDYSQLGLRHKLHRCECLHNQAVCNVKQGDLGAAEDLLKKASLLDPKNRHVLSAMNKLQCRSEFDLVTLPTSAIFRPPRAKIANMQKKDYLGKAQVVSSIKEGDSFSGFAGPSLVSAGLIKQTNSAPSSPQMKRKNNLEVKPDESSRSKSIEDLKRTLPRPSPPSTPVPRHMVPVTRISKGNAQKPILPSREQANGHSTSSKHIPRIQVDTTQYGDSGPPALPPKSVSPGQSSKRVPPSRPAPKLLHKQPAPPPKGAIASRPATKPVEEMVEVRLTSNEVITVKVMRGTSLERMMQLACDKFGYPANSTDIWSKSLVDGEMFCLTKDADLQNLWSKHSSDTLDLWCYGRL